MITLRPYQNQIIAETRLAMKSGKRSILICAPTGAGKTALTASMLSTAAQRNISSVFIVHRRELINQSIRAFNKIGLNSGVIASGFIEEPKFLTQIASIGSLVKRFDKIRKPKLIVWDECHHLGAKSWSKIFKAFPNSFHVGLTATPERLDGKGLAEYFDHMVLGPSTAWLIDNGYLSKYTLFTAPKISLSGVHSRMGDFVKSDLAAAFDKPTITGNAINEYKKTCLGARAVVFCVSIEHSKHVVAQFNASNIPAVHVDGETPTHLRDLAIKRFESGEIKILSNVDLFGEGFDLPAIECGILLRPTQSLGLYLQQVGRTLRTFEGKSQAIILDHAGNYDRHGLPDDEREWSLIGRESFKKGEKKDSIKVCPKCFAAQKPGRPDCGYCGYVYKVQSREVDEVDGELVEINRERALKKKEQGQAQSLEELTEIGRKRGYKRPHMWAKYVYNGRQKKKLMGG